MRISVMRIVVLNCEKNTILESKCFIRIVPVSPVYFRCDSVLIACGQETHAIFAVGIYILTGNWLGKACVYKIY